MAESTTMVSGSALVLIVAIGTTCFAGQEPAFDAASIKPHVGGARPAMRVTRSGVDFTNTSVREILQTAYQVSPQQISTTSDLSARYDVIARSGSSATREQLMAMLRMLLGARFNMKVHYEEREAQVFALVVGTKGSRLKPANPDAESAAAMPTPSGAALGISALAVPGGMRFVSSSLFDLAHYLSRTPIGRPVVDETGLAGRFDFTLQVAPPNDPATEASVRAAIAEGDPTVWTDALDQLGLKLESKRRRIRMLVVDSIQKPTDN
jgi:uncharacterized protein (TIGR03435 family)